MQVEKTLNVVMRGHVSHSIMNFLRRHVTPQNDGVNAEFVHLHPCSRSVM